MMQMFLFLFVVTLSVRGVACPVTQEDGSVIDDPSLTSCAAPAVTSESISEIQTDSLVGTTERMKKIDELCNESSKNYLYSGYGSSKACYDAQNSVLSTDRSAINAQAAAKAKADAEAAKEASANKQQQQPQSPQSPQSQQPQQQADSGKKDDGKKDEGKKDDTAKAAEAGDGKDKGGQQCKKSVMAAMDKCIAEKKAAEVACDPKQHEGLEAANTRLNTDATLAAAQGAQVTQNSERLALSRQQTGVAALDFSGSCKTAAAQCGSVCENVKTEFEKSCSSAPAKEKAEAQKVVDTSQDKEKFAYKLYCKIDLDSKGDKAAAEGVSQGSTAGQHADVGQSANGSGLAGAAGAMSALAGLMGKKGESDSKTEAASKELEYQKQLTEAAEGTAATCAKSQFRCLPSCVSYNASAGIVSTVGSCATQSAVISNPTTSPVTTTPETTVDRTPTALDPDAP